MADQTNADDTDDGIDTDDGDAQYVAVSLAGGDLLTNQQARVYTLRYVVGLSRQEAADELEISESVLDDHAAAARKKIDRASETLTRLATATGHSRLAMSLFDGNNSDDWPPHRSGTSPGWRQGVTVGDDVPEDAQRAALHVYDDLGGGTFPVFAVARDEAGTVVLDIELNGPVPEGESAHRQAGEVRRVVEDHGWQVEEIAPLDVAATWRDD